MFCYGEREVLFVYCLVKSQICFLCIMLRNICVFINSNLTLHVRAYQKDSEELLQTRAQFKTKM